MVAFHYLNVATMAAAGPWSDQTLVSFGPSRTRPSWPAHYPSRTPSDTADSRGRTGPICASTPGLKSLPEHPKMLAKSYRRPDEPAPGSQSVRAKRCNNQLLARRIKKPDGNGQWTVDLTPVGSCGSNFREEVCPFAARQKLNDAYVNGTLIVAAVAGLVCKSWTVFFVASAALVIGAIYCGDVRPGPRRR
jgi:hypothetical protein